MIHTKSLIRRLAYVPWLLAFGLVLGWAGEAAAQDIRLTVDKSSLREDGGAQTFKVTATNYAAPGTDAAKTKVTGVKIVLLTYSDDADDAGGLNVNYTVTQAAITIANDTDAGTAEITITPTVVNSDPVAGETVTGDGTNEDFTITISGTAGNFDDETDTNAAVLFVDTHKPTSTITLSVSPDAVSQEAGPTTITVTGILNGEKLTKKNLTFPVIVVGTDDFDPDPEGVQGVRDTDYTITALGNLTVLRKKEKGTSTFTIDPRNGTRWVGIGTPTRTAPSDNTTGRPTVDLRYDAVDTADDPATTEADQNESLDGTNDDGAATAEEQEVTVVPTTLSISEKKVAELKGGEAGTDGLTANPASVREEVGTVDIELTVTLTAALSEPAPVNFTVTDGENAKRDINYTIEFGDLTIPADETSMKTTATLTVVDDEDAGGDRIITVNANVANSNQSTNITITDNDLLTENITLKAVPAELKEDAEGNEEGYVDVMITATLDGAVFDDDVTLKLVLDGGSATRDQDYTAIIRSLKIDAEEVSGSTMISINPVDDGAVDADETIFVKSITALKNDDDDDINVGSNPEGGTDNRAKITLKDTGDKAAPEDPDDTTPAFSEEDVNSRRTRP